MFVYTKKDTTPCCENNVINPKARKMLYDDEKSGESVKSARRRGGKDKICARGWANQTPCLQINGHQQAKRAFVKDYLPMHPEVGDWADDVPYSINKNGRWDLQPAISQLNHDTNHQREKAFNSFNTTEVHNAIQSHPNKTHRRPTTTTFFQAEYGVSAPFIKGKRNTQEARSSYCPENGAKFRPDTEESCTERHKMGDRSDRRSAANSLLFHTLKLYQLH